MAGSEFDLIDQYFKAPFAPLLSAHASRVPVGIGDDCAVLSPDPEHRLFVSTDTLVSGVHFYPDVEPSELGWKALAVNLSDLAACGAEPLGFALALSLPNNSPTWLKGFSEGLLNIAQTFCCPLVGGDTTKAAHPSGLSINITVFGQAPVWQGGFARSAAQVGDRIWLAGLPGLARIGLMLEADRRGVLNAVANPQMARIWPAFRDGLTSELKHLASQQLKQPQPHIQLGLQLRGLANACLDTSDGLSGDIEHIAKASRVALVVDESAVMGAWQQAFPVWFAQLNAIGQQVLLDCALTGGDDYGLCFTAPPMSDPAILQCVCGHPLFKLGEVRAGQGVWLQPLSDITMNPVPLKSRSFTHF